MLSFAKLSTKGVQNVKKFDFELARWIFPLVMTQLEPKKKLSPLGAVLCPALGTLFLVDFYKCLTSLNFKMAITLSF